MTGAVCLPDGSSASDGAVSLLPALPPAALLPLPLLRGRRWGRWSSCLSLAVHMGCPCTMGKASSKLLALLSTTP